MSCLAAELLQTLAVTKGLTERPAYVLATEAEQGKVGQGTCTGQGGKGQTLQRDRQAGRQGGVGQLTAD